uniref:Endonuclease GajA/Old nuclease/RecF-like AAA domain-containing protein n=1 Tax=Eubacterium plexicaudatum ASF492 TaxID=1235802 RepID=N2A9R8_9FIRM
MELVFIYIVGLDDDFIRNQGFNFSSNYNFYVSFCNERYELRQKECRNILPENFFDSSSCITNITAIIGENGSGKTTLLNKLAKDYLGVRKIKCEPEYEIYYEEEYKKDMYIAVYIENGELICYRNIDRFANFTGVKDIYLFEGSEKLTEMVRNNTRFRNISRICLTNSMYPAWNGIAADKSIDKIHLNMNSLNVLKNMFYEKKCKKIKSARFLQYQDIIKECRKNQDFQQVLDVIYLQYMKEKENGILTQNINGNLTVRFLLFTKYFYDKFKGIENSGEQGKYLKECYDKVKALMSNFDSQLLKQDVFCSLYIDLLFELHAYAQVVETDEGKNIRNKQALLKYLKESIDILSERKDENAEFFNEALNEIQEYEQCLSLCRMHPNSLPVSDSAYVAYKEIEYESSSYYGILNLVRKSAFERKYSFVLKYIDIGGLKLASGERALLNFFSWLYIVPYFRCIDTSLETSLRDNILLLIDEIDLYCHPLWQQKLIYYLIEEARALFSGKKVQIVFTTHSPIVLSDMPQNNVIYLTRKNGRCVIDHTMQDTKTFGANIYKLFVTIQNPLIQR